MPREVIDKSVKDKVIKLTDIICHIIKTGERNVLLYEILKYFLLF